ncbi:MAG: glycosyltransferase [Pirellulaceae bacterium]
MTRRLRRLLVTSHVVHYRHEGQLFAYGPYTREIDIWADLFAEVVIASPCRQEAPPGDCLAFSRPNIHIDPQWETGGDDWWSKCRQFFLLPGLVWGLIRAMLRADALHVRCPGNLGLLGSLLGPLFVRYRVAKYAGQWNGYRGEGLTVRWQRRLLRSRWWGQPVTVYGEWPDQPPHVHSFFTSMMSDKQVRDALIVADAKQIGGPLRILFCGRLVPEKRVVALIDAAALIRQAGMAFELVIVGDGPERNKLELQVRESGLSGHVTFVGALPYDEALTWYEWAHCLVLPSRHSEGWPKVVAEAMCYGIVCIAVDHGQVGRMLKGRGKLLARGDAGELAEALHSVVSDPEASRELGRAAAGWSRTYSLEGLREALYELLCREWSVELRKPCRNPMPRQSSAISTQNIER